MSNILEAQTTVTDISSGIEPGAHKDLAQSLSEALADTFSLYVKTLGVHWNAVGPAFFSLHKMTEEQYEDMQDAIDEVAERIRAIGHPAPAGFSEFRDMSIVDSEKTLSKADTMITELADDNEAVAKRLRKAAALAEKHDDVFTADLLIARIGKHEQNVWMLRALIAQ